MVNTLATVGQSFIIALLSIFFIAFLFSVLVLVAWKKENYKIVYGASVSRRVRLKGWLKYWLKLYWWWANSRCLYCGSDETYTRPIIIETGITRSPLHCRNCGRRRADQDGDGM